MHEVSDCGTACVVDPTATLTFDDGGAALDSGQISDCSAWTHLGTVGSPLVSNAVGLRQAPSAMET